MGIASAIGGALSGGSAGSKFGLGNWGTAGGAALGALGGFLGPSYDPDRGPTKHDREPLIKGIQWRVNDAKAAGLHPLYALGAPSFSPAYNTHTGTSGNAMVDGLNSVAGAISHHRERKAADRAAARTERLDRAQIAESQARARQANASAMRDLVAAQAASSELARAKIDVNARQDQSTGAGNVYVAPNEKLKPGGIVGGHERTLELAGPGGEPVTVKLGPGVPAATIEDEWGGIWNELYGFTKGLRDMGYSGDQLGITGPRNKPHKSKRW